MQSIARKKRYTVNFGWSLAVPQGMRKLFLALFLSDHPSPGNRIKAVEDVARHLPQRTYSADTGRFTAIKQLVSTIEIPPARRPVSRNQ
jgi:hypothetical protein